MKTQVLCVMAVALLGLALFLGSSSAKDLPGKDVGNGELAKVWAARTNPSGTGAGQCTVTCGSGCSGAAGVGSQCGGETFTGALGNITCTGAASQQQFAGGTEPCVGAQTVKVCEYVGLVLKCTNTATVTFPGTRTYCRVTGYTFPKEP